VKKSLVALVLAALTAVAIHQWRARRSYGSDFVAAVLAEVPERSPERGRILDRNGAPLAENRRAFDVYVTPRLFTRQVRTRLIGLLHLDADEVARLDRGAALGAGVPDRPVRVLEDQGRKRAGLILRSRDELKGAVEVHRDLRRHYPQRQLAAHLLGYVEPTERTGAYGIERAFERWLKGRARAGASGVAGDDVVLTLDLDLQKAAEKAVQGHTAAAVVVVEVETGRILAMVSRPSFDPNALSGTLAIGELERLKRDPSRPLIDRTLEETYPPASTFKMVTAVAGLESKMASPDEEVVCTGERSVGGRVLHDMDVHGAVHFVEALQRSCNIYFWTIGERVGIDRLARVAREFGFGSPSGLGLNGDVAGQVPDRAMLGAQADENLILTLNAAVGLGEVRATVVQLAMAYAALANGGRLYQPQVVRRVESASGESPDEREPVLRRTIDVSPATLALIRQGMTKAVNSRGGTAFSARKGAVKMGGKTGTELRGRPVNDPSDAHAWFAGWAPDEQPEIAVVVLVERGGVGGLVAAPLAHDIVDAYFTHRQAAARRTAPRHHRGR